MFKRRVPGNFQERFTEEAIKIVLGKKVSEKKALKNKFWMVSNEGSKVNINII